MERIGVYGGTFNPPHMGHIQAARQAMEALDLQKLLLIPDGEAPHKSLPAGSPTSQQRLEMLSLAAAGEKGMEVSSLELERQGKSYTFQTMQALGERYPEAELYLILGTDMFECFHQWREPEKILAAATLAVVCRGEKGERQRCEKQLERIRAMGGRAVLLENTAVPISSTQLRRLIAFRCAGEFLNPAVAAYIREQGLYDATAAWKNLPMAELEQVVIRLLNPNRVAHVLGCRDTAVALAKRWGADEVDAGRAGILHDITKALDGPLQLTLCRAYGTVLDDFSQKNPKTLHALTGALVAGELFGENERVVSAIRSHTTGKANMNLLETILYVADYMEPNRDFPGVEKLRELAFSDLRAALKLGLEMTLDHLKEQGSEISPESREALDYLNQNTL